MNAAQRVAMADQACAHLIDAQRSLVAACDILGAEPDWTFTDGLVTAAGALVEVIIGAVTP